MGWFELRIFIRSLIVEAQGFIFRHFNLNSFQDKCFNVVYCLPNMISKCVRGVYNDGLEVVFGYEIIYFLVVMLIR